MMNMDLEALKSFNLEEDRVILAFDDCIAERIVGDFLLDFGCGKNRKEGFCGIDIFEHNGINYVHDIDQDCSFPIAGNSVSGIRAIHSVEHVNDWVTLWNEFYRICVPNALLYIVVPHPTTMYYLGDPSHKTPYTEDTFRKYLSGEYIEQYSDYGLRCKFKVEALQIAGASIDKLSIHCILRTVKDESP